MARMWLDFQNIFSLVGFVWHLAHIWLFKYSEIGCANRRVEEEEEEKEEEEE